MIEYHWLVWLLQNEPEFRFLERQTEVKGRRSQNWERSGSDRLGRKGLDEFQALQADSDDCELAIRFDRHIAKMEVGHIADATGACWYQAAVICIYMYHVFMCHVFTCHVFMTFAVMHESVTNRSYSQVVRLLSAVSRL